MAPKKIPPTAILSAVKVLFGLLCVLIANFSRTLIKQRLIPSQLEVIGTVGSLFILVGLLLTLVYWSRLHKFLSASIIATCISLLALTIMHLNFVKSIKAGQPAQEYNYLIGYSLTEEGRHRGDPEHCGPLGSEEAYIECGGSDRIPAWYGTSYTVMKTAYTLLYLLFMVGVVLTIGGVLRRGGNELVELVGAQDNANHNPPPQAANNEVVIPNNGDNDS